MNLFQTSSMYLYLILGLVVIGCKSDNETPIITDPPAAFNGSLAWV